MKIGAMSGRSRWMAVSACLALQALAGPDARGQTLLSAPASVSAPGVDVGVLVALEPDMKMLKARMFPMGGATAYAGREFQKLRGRCGTVLAAVSKAGLQATGVTADAMLMKFGARRLISVGVAGALDDGYAVGDIVVVRTVKSHERGTHTAAMGFVPAEEATATVEWDGWLRRFDRAFREIASSRGIGVKEGVLASGNAFIASGTKRAELRERQGAGLVDMNSAALVEAAGSLRVPLYIVRVVSDSADEDAGPRFGAFIDAYEGNGGRLMEMVIEGMQGMEKEEGTGE